MSNLLPRKEPDETITLLEQLSVNEQFFSTDGEPDETLTLLAQPTYSKRINHHPDETITLTKPSSKVVTLVETITLTKPSPKVVTLVKSDLK